MYVWVGYPSELLLFHGLVLKELLYFLVTVAQRVPEDLDGVLAHGRGRGRPIKLKAAEAHRWTWERKGMHMLNMANVHVETKCLIGALLGVSREFKVLLGWGKTEDA